jgi:hypothetical protein
LVGVHGDGREAGGRFGAFREGIGLREALSRKKRRRDPVVMVPQSGFLWKKKSGFHSAGRFECPRIAAATRPASFFSGFNIYLGKKLINDSRMFCFREGRVGGKTKRPRGAKKF